MTTMPTGDHPWRNLIVQPPGCTYTPPQSGWQCPVCGRGNAPWVPSCDCHHMPGTVTCGPNPSTCGCGGAGALTGMAGVVKTTLDVMRQTRAVLCVTALDPLLGDPRAARAAGAAGAAFAATHRGATRRTLEALRPLLERALVR